MDSTLHTHIAAIHVQERIAFAERERLARSVVRQPRPRRRPKLRLTARRQVGKVVAGP
jgi:hypothetical protein